VEEIISCLYLKEHLQLTVSTRLLDDWKDLQLMPIAHICLLIRQAGLVQAYAAQLVTVFSGIQIAVFIWLAVDEKMTIADATGMMSLFLTLTSPVRMLAGFFRTALTNAGSTQRIDEFIEDTSRVRSLAKNCNEILFGRQVSPWLEEAYSSTQSIGSKQPLRALKNPTSQVSLCVRDITFRYPGSPTDVLQNVSLTIEAGEFAAIVGESGCGKSTLLSLLMTWLRPSKGRVAFGSDVRIRAVVTCQDETDDSAAAMLRRQSAVVFQETMLLKGTVLDNIVFGSPEGVGLERAEWAAAAAGVAGIIDGLPKGYLTEIGSGGATLSGGQAQRICIARALCRKPRLLLLDEATSALDPETEDRILDTVSNLRTQYPEDFGSLIIVSVTHHPNTLKYSDVVIRMAGGRVESMTRTKRALERP